MKQRFLSLLVLLMVAVTGAWAEDTYNVTFRANGNTKVVENVTLPHTFWCYYNGNKGVGDGELDLIIQELYGLSGGWCDEDYPWMVNPVSGVTVGFGNDNQYFSISTPFEGTAQIKGWYYRGWEDDFVYNLDIAIAAVEPEPEPQPAGYSVTLKEGTEDAENWTIEPTEAAAGTQVTVTYSGLKKVKSVKAVKKASAEPEPAEPTLADVFTDGAVVGVSVKNTYDTYTVTGTYSGGSYTSITKSSNDIEEVTMTKDGNNLVVWIKNDINSECTLTFNTQDNTYTKSFKAGTGAAVWDISEFVSITVNGVDITSTLTDATPAASTVTWDFTQLEGSADLFGGYENGGVTLQGMGDLNFDNGTFMVMGTGTFTAPSGKKFTSIVITVDPDTGGYADISGFDYDYFATATWSGSSTSVSFSDANADRITSIVFTLEDE